MKQELQIPLLDPAQSQREAREGGGFMGELSSENLKKGFELFWDLYPRRQARKDAWKAWQKLNPSDHLQGQMLAAIEYQAKGKQWRDGFVPLPATWLRGERWNDELDPTRDFYRARL